MPPELPFIPGPRQYRTDVAGTDQVAIVRLVGPRRQERLHIQARAQLVLQDDEPVQVSIQGHQVGQLSRERTQALHRIIRYGKRSPHETFECAALIVGTMGNYRARLDLPLDD